MSEIFIIITLSPEHLPFDIDGLFTHFEADREISIDRVELPEKVSESRVKR